HAEGNGAVLLHEPFAQLAELLDHGVDGSSSLAAEQIAGMEHDDFCARGLRDTRRMVEHADRHVELLATFGVTHEARDRRMDGENDPGRSRELTELLRPRVVHPELPLEVDLASRVAPFLQECDRLLGTLPGRHASRAVVELGHLPRVQVRCQALDMSPAGGPSDPVSTLIPWSISRHASTFWSSTSTSGSPTSGARPGRSRNGISTSLRPSCAPPTGRAIAMR